MSKTIRVIGVLAAIVALTAVSGAQEAKQEEVLLRWKVPAGKTIAFKTSMDPVNPAQQNIIKVDIEQLAEGTDMPADTRNEMHSLELPKVYSVTSTLETLPSGNLLLKMIMGKISMPEPTDPGMNKDMEFLKKMEGMVQLESEITESGEIVTFYLEPKQKNLVALFFELPKGPVGAGDTWALDVNLLSMGPGFHCEKADRTNRVELVSLSQSKDGDIIAAMDYHIAESVRGEFQTPFSQGPQPAYMAMSFIGHGEFFVNKGFWKKFVGRMSIKATGMMSSDIQQHFAMEPMEPDPKVIPEAE